jgi:VWFA-related protein
MTRRFGALAVSASVTLAAVTLTAQQPPTFRSGTNAVVVDVSVRKGNVAVPDLTSADFVVTDNGKPQPIASVEIERLPVNVTLLLDTSGSVTPILNSLKAQVAEAAAMLGDDDRIRLLVFASDASQVVPMQSPRLEIATKLDGIKGDGMGTSLYDALAAALIRQRQPDRGELVVAFTDGIDTTSAMGVKRLNDIAQRSEAVMHAFIVRTPSLVRLCAGVDVPQGDAMPWLCDQTGLARVAEATGGRLHETSPGRHVPDGLRRALDDFRTSYTLRYTLTGVERPGWHEIKVSVTNPVAKGATIRARRGYFGR